MEHILTAAQLYCLLTAALVCIWHDADCCCWAAGICTMTCHKAHNVFDVVPGDVVGSVILTTAAATVQVRALHLADLTAATSASNIWSLHSRHHSAGQCAGLSWVG